MTLEEILKEVRLTVQFTDVWAIEYKAVSQVKAAYQLGRQHVFDNMDSSSNIIDCQLQQIETLTEQVELLSKELSNQQKGGCR